MTAPLSRRRGLRALILIALSLSPGLATAQDASWSRAPELRGIESGCFVFDSARDRLVLIDGSREGLPTDEVYVSPAEGTPDWHWLETSGPNPPARMQATAIYDPLRDRVLMIGGGTGTTDVPATLWALSLAGPGKPAWTAIATAGGTPAPGLGAQLFYDAARDRAVLVAGYPTGQNAVLPLEVWTLSLTGAMTWAAVPVGAAPTFDVTRRVLSYDPTGDRLVAFGRPDNGNLGVAALALGSPSAWTVTLTPGPSPGDRRFASGCFDPVRQRVLMFGGVLGDTLRNDAWQLSLSATPQWQSLAPAGTPPSARWCAHVLYDPVRDRMLMFGGGYTFPADTYLVPEHENDTWALSLGASPEWQAVSPPSSGPPWQLSFHTLTFDRRRSRIISIGGYAGGYSHAGHASPPSPADISGLNALLVWSDSQGGRWQTVATTGPTPPSRYQHTATYDPDRDRILIVGGQGPSGPLADVWELQLATMHWNPILPTGAPVGPLYAHSTVLDPLRDRLVVCRGANVNQLTLSGTPAWSPVITQGTPPFTRGEESAILDPVRDRMIVTGGRFDSEPSNYDMTTNATWALSLSSPPTWTSLAPSPVDASQAQAIYDQGRDRMVVFGGGYTTGSWPAIQYYPRPSPRAYSLATGTWSTLTTTGSTYGRYAQGAVYDPLHDGILVFAGKSDNGEGLGNDYTYSQLWSLRFTATLDAPGGSARPHVLAAFAFPNPAFSTVTIRCALPERAASSVRVFDAQGRLIRTLANGILEPGDYSFRWDARDGQGGRAAAGLYFYEVRNGGARRVARLAVLE